jgi:hypothetical protein
VRCRGRQLAAAVTKKRVTNTWCHWRTALRLQRQERALAATVGVAFTLHAKRERWQQWLQLVAK